MEVKQFKKMYEALQKEGGEIYRDIKPILKRLKSLSRKCVKLADNADMDCDLYKISFVEKKDAYGNKYLDEVSDTDGWDTFVLLRLWDFGDLVENGTAIEELDDVLFNLKNTKFEKGKMNKKRRK